MIDPADVPDDPTPPSPDAVREAVEDPGLPDVPAEPESETNPADEPFAGGVPTDAVTEG